MLHLRNRGQLGAHRETDRRHIMDRIVRSAIGIAVAIGTSGLMFAATLA
jgi:hypothetical protein